MSSKGRQVGYMRRTLIEQVAQNERGLSLFFVIAAMLVVSILVVGIHSMSSKTAIDQAESQSLYQAVYLAQAGMNHAAAWHKYHEDMLLSAAEKAQNFQADANVDGWDQAMETGSFTLSASQVEDDPSAVDVTSTGHAGGNAHDLLKRFFFLDSSDDDDDDDDGGGIDTGEGQSELALNSMNGNQNLDNQNLVEGSVSGKNVVLGNQSEVTGNIFARGNVQLINHAIVGGGICAGGDVTLQNQTFVAGDIHAQGHVTLGANSSEVSGSVYAGGDVGLQNGAQVMGEVHAGGSVSLGANNSKVHNSVFAGGTVTMGHLTSIGDQVQAGGNVRLVSQATVESDVTAKGDVTLGNQSVIEGDVTAGGAIVHGWQTRILGSEHANTSNPPVVDPTEPAECQVCTPRHAVFTPGSRNITINWQADRAIDPGSWGVLTLGGANKVYLTSGRYTFKRIYTGTRPSLYLDVSAGDIEIFVQGDVVFGDQLKVYVNGNAITQGNHINEDLRPLAARVYLETLDSFTMSNQNQWFGTIYAKNNITFSNQNLLVGSYHSSSGRVIPGNQMEVYFVQSKYAKDHWTCD